MRNLLMTASTILLSFALLGTAQAGCSDHGTPDIVDTAVAAGSFDTLVAAVKAADLVDALKGDGPLTVFAPTDEAFAKLPAGTLDKLLQPENKGLLTAILTYHVAAGKLGAADVVSRDRIETLNGERPRIRVEGDRVRIDGANIVKTDIETSNGVIHVIDSVILPQAVQDALAANPARELIELAIAEGAPLYNRNQPAACAAVYRVAARSLIDFEDAGLDAHQRSRLERALARAERSHDADDRAWILRRALDSVYSSMGPARPMMTVAN